MKVKVSFIYKGKRCEGEINLRTLELEKASVGKTGLERLLSIAKKEGIHHLLEGFQLNQDMPTEVDLLNAFKLLAAGLVLQTDLEVKTPTGSLETLFKGDVVG